MKKHKKTFLIVFAAFLLLVSATVMTACDPDEPDPQPYSVTIATAEDFRAVSEKLGEASSLGTFTLSADIDLGSDHTPLGNGADTSFRGVLDGAGHTVTYTISHTAAEATGDAELTPEATRYWGLFGYLYDATVKNLTVNVKISSEADSEVTYIGGLAAFAYGKVKLENVTFTGDINLGYGYLDNYNATLSTGYKLIAYAGGAFGYAEGDMEFTGVDSAVDITVEGRFALNDRSCIDEVYAGGIAGLIRTENNTSAAGSYVKASDVSADGVLNIKGTAVTAGGLFGLAQRAVVSGAAFNGDVETAGSGKVICGGIAGLYDQGTIDGAAVGTETEIGSDSVEGTTLSAGTLTSANSTYLANIGGITGYISFGSIKNAIAFVYMETGDGGLNNYSGGITGQLYNSTLNSAASAGTFVNIAYPNYAGNDDKTDYHAQYAAVGGIAGRVYGLSEYDKVYSAMAGVYQGIAGEIVNGVETVTLEAGQTIQALYPGYAASDSQDAASAKGTYKKIGDDDENKYIVTHRPVCGEAEYWYAAVDEVNYKEDLYYDYYDVTGIGHPGTKVAKEDLITAFNGILQSIKNR